MQGGQFQMNVCYFGAYNTDYPRNQILRMGLSANGATVIECRVGKGLPGRRRIPMLIDQYRRVWRQCDVLVLAEFGQSLAPLAWALARITQKPLVADLLISYYEMAVEVRRTFRRGSWSAGRYYWLDALAVRLADASIVDAEPHRNRFINQFGGHPDRVRVIPLGVNDEHFKPVQRATPHSTCEVLYYGSYTPAHGVETMIRAAGLLKNRSDVAFRFMGVGQDRPAAEALARDLGLSGIRFEPPVPYADLPAQIATADICLGEFGDTLQTKHGLANKVYQSLAMGKPLINGDTPSIRSLFTPGEHLEVSPLADADALAQMIAALVEDPARRQRLAQAGQRWTLERYTPRPLGKALLNTIMGVLK